MHSSVVLVKVSHSSVGCDLGVDVASLTLIHVDLGLEGFYLLGLDLKKLLDLELLLHDVSLLLIILVDEDGLVGVIQLLVKVQFFFSELSDEVEEVGIVLHFSSQLTLRPIEFSFCIFNHLDTTLFGLLELVLQVSSMESASTTSSRRGVARNYRCSVGTCIMDLGPDQTKTSYSIQKFAGPTAQWRVRT